MATRSEHPDYWIASDGTEMWADLPLHFPMGVDEEGRGPAKAGDIHHYICWCGEPDCIDRYDWDTGEPRD